MKISELKKELKSKGLPVTGNKQELIDRLTATVSSDLLDENDDDLDQDEQMTEEAIKEAEKELQSQANTSLSEEGSNPEETNKSNGEETENAEGKENKVDPPKDTSKEKLSTNGDEAEAKIKARAERFGGFQSDEAKKVARAARFGDTVANSDGKANNKKIGSAPAVDLDTLKKRADRFGSAVSPLVREAEVSEAIKRRQERFGIVTKEEPKPKKVLLNAGVNSVLLDEKLKARAARFQL